MKISKFTMIVALFLATTGVYAKNRVTPTYMFGIAASFNDSTVYFTGIQKVDSAYINTKTKFLAGRDNYSYQLKNYLASKGEANRTCITTFAFSEKDIKEKYNKVLKKYTDSKKGTPFDIRYLKNTDFSFKFIVPYEISDAEEAAKEKAAKEARKRIRNTQDKEHGGPGKREGNHMGAPDGMRGNMGGPM